MAEAFLVGLIGFLIGKGIPREDAEAVVKGLQEYLGFEPPLGLTGYSLRDMEKGKKLKTCVVVRGKTYNAVALEDIAKYSCVSVLGKRGGYLEIAPTIESLKLVSVLGEIIATVRWKEEAWIRNPGFEAGLQAWSFLGGYVGVESDPNLVHSGFLCARFDSEYGMIAQLLREPLDLSGKPIVTFWLRASDIDFTYMYFRAYYTDETMDEWTLKPSIIDTWEIFCPSYDWSKTLERIVFHAIVDVGHHIYLDDVVLKSEF